MTLAVSVLGGSARSNISLTWQEKVRDFELRCRALNISNRTWGIYRFHLNAYADSADPRAYLELRRAQGWSASTLHGAYRVLRTFYRHLKSEGLIDSSPITFKAPKIPKTIPPSFTAETLNLLLAQIKKDTDFGARDYALVIFYADTGARLTEALGMRIQDVSLERCSALLHGKGGKDRIVGFGQTTRRALLNWLRRRPQVQSDYLFISRWGGRLAGCTVDQKIKKLTRKAGIASLRLNAHALRHYCAISMLRNGADPKSVQRQLGHEDLTMTMNYVNQLEAESVKVAQDASPLDRAGVGGYGKSVMR